MSLTATRAARFAPPPPLDHPITQWARTRLESIQTDIHDFEDDVFLRLSAASGHYHADRLCELAESLRLHADMIEQRAAKFREASDG